MSDGPHGAGGGAMRRAGGLLCIIHSIEALEARAALLLDELLAPAAAALLLDELLAPAAALLDELGTKRAPLMLLEEPVP